MKTREAAIEALFAKLSPLVTAGRATRRLYNPETFCKPGETALFLITHHETYSRPAPNSPRKLVLDVSAIIYVNVSNDLNAIPDAVLNPIEDAVDNALAPDNTPTGMCTLSGTVYSCIINGEVTRAPGDKTGQGLAVIPIQLTLP